MQEPEQGSQSDFMIEKIKERPVNKRKLFRRTLITAAMAVLFGSVACVTFLVLQPVINNKLYPEEEAHVIVFPEDPQEMPPEEMLTDDSKTEENPENVVLEQDQIQEILSEVVLNKENYRQIYSALSEYAGELSHSMVTITGVSSHIDWFNNVEESKKQSSGIIIANNRKELLVLADYTPLKNAQSMTMSFEFFKASDNAWMKSQVDVSLKMLDSTTNLAVLSVNLSDLPADAQREGGVKIASLGYSNTKNIVGMPVVALGSPMGVSDSIGYGMITAVSSQSAYADSNYKTLQTDIYGSQSAGGVLFNMQGQVIGIITNQKSGSDMKNIICAYGITELKNRIEKLSNGVPMAYLGILGTDVTREAHDNLKVPYGTYVKKVDMNSPSMRAGIQQGDVLTAFGDREIQVYSDYISALMQTEAGATVELTVMRAAQGEYRRMKISVVLGER